MKVIVIGGQIAGSTFAVEFKKNNPDDEVILINKNVDISYIPSALSYILKNDAEKEDITLYSKEYMNSLGINVYSKSEVISVNDKQKELKLIKGISGSINVLSYDKLVIASGCNSIKLPVFENKGDNIFIFKNVLNALRLKKYIKEHNPKNALIVGGGPTGIEVFNLLKELNIDVDICEEKRLISQFDPIFSKYLEELLKDNDVNVIYGEVDEVKAGKKLNLKINNDVYKYDMAIICVGLIPNSSYMQNTDLNMTENGYIFVKDNFETNLKDIYAIGDIAIVKAKGLEEYILPKLASSAKKQAIFLANNLKDGRKVYNGTNSPMIIKAQNRYFAKIGINGVQAQENNIDYIEVNINMPIEPKYIDKDENNILVLKAMFDTNLKFLGIELFGDKTVELLMSYFTAALKKDFLARDFLNEEIAYTPKNIYLSDIINELGKEAIKKLED